MIYKIIKIGIILKQLISKNNINKVIIKTNLGY